MSNSLSSYSVEKSIADLFVSWLRAAFTIRLLRLITSDPDPSENSLLVWSKIVDHFLLEQFSVVSLDGLNSFLVQRMEMAGRVRGQ